MISSIRSGLGFPPPSNHNSTGGPLLDSRFDNPSFLFTVINPFASSQSIPVSVVSSVCPTAEASFWSSILPSFNCAKMFHQSRQPLEKFSRAILTGVDPKYMDFLWLYLIERFPEFRHPWRSAPDRRRPRALRPPSPAPGCPTRGPAPPSRSRSATSASGPHAGYDRMVYEFANGRFPEIEVSRVKPPFKLDPSDLPVTIDGSAFLKIRLNHVAVESVPAAADDMKPGYPMLVEVRQIAGCWATRPGSPGWRGRPASGS